MIEVFIEKEQVDVNETFSTLLNFAVADVRDFGSKNTTFSKTVLLPGTKRNNKLFGHIFQAGRFTFGSNGNNIGINFNAAKSADVIIFSENVQCFKGVVRLLEIINYGAGSYEYEVAFIGELGGLLSAMANKKLEDLDFSAYDHTYNASNVSGSWLDYNAGEGYYYPLIDYGGVSTNKKDWDIRAFRPALFVREYLKKLFEVTGYTYQSDFIDNSALFDSLIIPHNQKALTKISQRLLTATETNGSLTVTGAQSNVSFDTAIGGNFTINGGNNLFTWNPANSVLVNIKCPITANYTAGDAWEIVLQINSIDVDSFSFPSAATSEAINIELNYEVTLNQNDVIRLIVRNPNATTIIITQLNALLTVDAAAPTVTLVAVGDSIVINDTIPRGIFLKDFLSSICKMFNLYVKEDKFKSRHLIIEPYIDFYADQVDWSNKVDRSKPIRYRPMSELNSRFYEFKYRADNDFYNENYRKKFNEGYGDRLYDNGFEFSKDKTTVEIIFAASVLVGYDGEDKIAPAIYKKANNVEDSMEHVVRIMQAKRKTGVALWDLKNAASVLASYTEYGYAGHFNDPNSLTSDIGFGVPKELFIPIPTTGSLSSNLFNVYYSPYLAEITDPDSKMMMCTVYLTRRDINELDLGRYVFIDGSLWRINKIIDYNVTNEDTCQAEFLKVINTSY